MKLQETKETIKQFIIAKKLMEDVEKTDFFLKKDTYFISSQDNDIYRCIENGSKISIGSVSENEIVLRTKVLTEKYFKIVYYIKIITIDELEYYLEQ